MIYKCPNCSASLRYDINNHRMVCDYCCNEYSVAEIEGSVLRDQEVAQTMETKIFVCSACGAELMINDVETATFCAYCGQPTIVFDRISTVRKPDLILPFKVTKEEACAAIKQKLLKGFFIPSRYKKIQPEMVRGIYIPFIVAEGHYEEHTLLEGEVGGTTIKVKRNYYRHMEANFLGLPVDSSVRFDDELADRLAPFPYEDMQTFDPAYLSGFYADTGDESQSDLNKKIHDKVLKYFNAKMVGYRQTKIETKDQFEINDVKHTMIPMWFFLGKSGKRRCTILVNGCTGKVVGAIPIVKMKVVLLSILVGIPTILLFAYLGSLVAPFFTDMGVLKRDLLIAFSAFCLSPYIFAYYALQNYRKGLALTKSKSIVDFAKNRQDK